MYKHLSRKVVLVVTAIFLMCVFAYTLSTAVNVYFPVSFQSGQNENNADSLMNTGLPQAYFVPDRSATFLFENKEFTLGCVFMIIAFSVILFVSLVYCIRYTDRHTKTRIVLLI